MKTQKATDLLLRNGRLIDPSSGRDEVMDLHIVDGIVSKLSTKISTGDETVAIDLHGAIVAPGFIDMHVHLREPGFEHKETIESGCAAAAAGGFTAVCCMPNTKPAIDDESVVRMIQQKSRSAWQGVVDVYPIAAVTIGRRGEHLAPIAELAQAGAVGFSDDGDPVYDAEIMRRALEYAAMFNRPIIQHAQDMPMTRGGVMNEGFVSTELGLPAMPGAAEDVVVARDIELTKYAGGKYHVAHLSTAGSVALVRSARAKGLDVSCEVTPHHFMLTDEAVRSFDTNTKMNPPLRGKEDVEAVIEGLRDGTIEVIATDHAPHSFDEKQVEYQSAPFGIVGLETAIGIAMTELVDKGVISIERLIRLFSTNPRRILGLPEITINAGVPANLTLLDPTAEWTVDSSRFFSKSRNTPFNGRRLKGKPLGVINNGVVCMIG